MKKWLVSLAILVSLFLALGIFAKTASADKKELEEIRQAIKESGAKWKADETSVSRLDPQELKKKMGTILDKIPPGKDNNKPEGNKPTPPPLPPTPDPSLLAYYDWRMIEGGKVTSIKDQGNCGSCWAFGSIAAEESIYLITHTAVSFIDFDLSEQDLVSCCTSCWGKPEGGCGGGFMYSAYDYLRDLGTSKEECFRYISGEVGDVSCNDDTNDTLCPKVKITEWKEVEWTGVVTQDLQALQQAVHDQPVPAAFYVYRDFLYYKEGVYKHVNRGNPNPVGGHAICIVGWDNDNNCFIVKNSWGTGWGESGYFRIDYSEVGSSVQFGRAAADFNMSSNPAPPRYSIIATLWGEMRTQ